TPVVERAVGNTQIARNLAHRLPAALYHLYRFNLKFPCIRSLCLLHDPFPFCVGFTLPSLLPSLLRVKTITTFSYELDKLVQRQIYKGEDSSSPVTQMGAFADLVSRLYNLSVGPMSKSATSI